MTGIITIAIIGITVLAVLGDTILGLVRGMNRSILRLVLVVLSAGAALIAYKPVVPIVMKMKFFGFSLSSLPEKLLSGFGFDIPESVTNLTLAMIEIALGIILFVVVFLVLRLLTWAIVFPILRIVVPKGNPSLAWVGAIAGLVQGVIVAVVICAPLNGLVIEAQKVTAAKFQDKPLVSIPANVGIDEYVGSQVSELYTKTGGWIFDKLSTTTSADGKTVSISSACNSLVTVLDITSTMAGLGDILGEINKPGDEVEGDAGSGGDAVPPKTNTEALKGVGDALIKIDNSIGELDEESKEIVQELITDVKDIASSAVGELPPEISDVIDNINVEELKLGSAGEAINGIAKYIENIDAPEEEKVEITQEDVDGIVGGLADNEFIIDMLGSNTEKLVDVDDESREMFESAINNADLSEENREALLKMFGLSGK